MKKRYYTAPSIRITETQLSAIILLTGIDEQGQRFITHGGTTSGANITEADAKSYIAMADEEMKGVTA